MTTMTCTPVGLSDLPRALQRIYKDLGQRVLYVDQYNFNNQPSFIVTVQGGHKDHWRRVDGQWREGQ